MADEYLLAPLATLAAAQRAIAAAIKEAEALAVDVCIAVTDGAGHLLAMARMDRAPLLCVQIAQDKAYSVAAFGGLPTSDWWPLLESEPALLHGIVKTDRLTVFGGGIPLVADGRAVGAIGVSGGSSEQDIRIAEAGAAALGRSPVANPSNLEESMAGSYVAFELDELERKYAAAGAAYNEFLRRRGMSLGLYTLPAGAEDHQQPHMADEVYIVLKGRGTLRVVDEEVELKAGGVVSVDHGEEHRIVNVAEDLELLVVFAPPDLPEED